VFGDCFQRDALWFVMTRLTVLGVFIGFLDLQFHRRGRNRSSPKRPELAVSPNHFTALIR